MGLLNQMNITENKESNDYHLSVHQDLMHLAGRERQFSLGAANYYHAAKSPDNGEIEKRYNNIVEPILKKHGYPDRFTNKMHDAQKEIVNNWRKELKEDIRQVKIKTFKQFYEHF